MSDIRILNLNKKSLLNKEYDINKIKDYLKENLYSLFNVTLISCDLVITDNQIDELKAEIIGYDDTYKLVIFEIRKDKYSYLIKKGLFILDYIKNHFNIVRYKIEPFISKDALKEIDSAARLVIIGEDFSIEDNKAIDQKPYEIDLVKCNLYGDNLLIEKSYQSYTQNLKQSTLDSHKDKKLITSFNEDILSLGSDITSSVNGSIITYRRIKTFLIIFLGNDVSCFIKDNTSLKEYKLTTDTSLEILEIVKKIYEES